MKEIFDKKFVHFMWDNKLEEKEGFFADGIRDLQDRVNGRDCEYMHKAHANSDSAFDDCPFCAPHGSKWRFFYYDPNYEVKYAFYKEGKAIEYRDKSTRNQWETCPNPMWLENAEYRIKLEETVDLNSYLKSKKWVKFNLNHYIEVKLNEKGERIYTNYFAKTALPLDSMKSPDEDGYRSFQMHKFMKIFGNHFGPSAQDTPCDMDVLVEIEE